MEKISSCVFCGCGCKLNYVIEDNHIVGVKPVLDDPCSKGKPCVKGLLGYEGMYTKRILSPMLRKGGKLKEVSWDEAYDLIKEKLSKLKSNELCFLGSGELNNEFNYVLGKLARTVFNTNNVDSTARLCHAATVFAFEKIYGINKMLYQMDDILDSDVILIIGSNPASNYPVFFNRIIEAKNKGTKLIVIDVEDSITANQADISLVLRGEALICFISGLIKAVIDYNKIKLDGIEELKEVVSKFDSEHMCEMCGVCPEKYSSALESILHAKKLSICYGMGLTQHINGVQNVFAVSNLALLKKAKLFPMRGKVNIQGVGDVGVEPKGSNLIKEKLNLFNYNSPKDDGKTLAENVFRNNNLKAMVICECNPAVSLPDLNFVHKRFEDLFIVYIGSHFCKTTEFAKVVLPIGLLIEEEGTITNAEGRVRKVNRLPSPYSLKEGWKIICELANHFGIREGFDYNNWLDIFNEIKQVVKGYSKINSEEDMLVEKENSGGKLMPFDTFIVEKGSPKYKWTLTTARQLTQFCTGEITTQCKSLLKNSPKAFCEINPEDAKEVGILNGDNIIVSSENGKIMVEAKFDPKQPKGVVNIPFHFDDTLVNVLFPHYLDELSMTPNLKIIKVNIKKATSKHL